MLVFGFGCQITPIYVFSCIHWQGGIQCSICHTVQILNNSEFFFFFNESYDIISFTNNILAFCGLAHDWWNTM